MVLLLAPFLKEREIQIRNFFFNCVLQYFVSALPKPPDVKLCFEGDAGILSGLSKEKIWIDHSTTDYTQMMEFNKLVTDKGAWAVEAPITGGLEALKKGQMTVFIAGDPKVADLVIITEGQNSEEKNAI